MRSIIFILLLLSLYFGICIFIGVKWAIAGFAMLLLILATVFITKKDSYIKYIEFINPKYALVYNSKSDNFRKKHRIIDIIVLYIISAIILFISVNMENTTLSIGGTIPIPLIVTTMIFTIILWGFSLLILRKSNKNSSFWFYFIAAILFIILVLGIIQSFLFY